MNMEQQSQGVTYQPEFDFTALAEWARPLGGGEGAIPTTAPTREQQVFAAWKEELNWGPVHSALSPIRITEVHVPAAVFPNP